MIIPFCAPSGVGKTTFIFQLSTLLLTKQFSLAVIKSTHHRTLKDVSLNTDSNRYKQLHIPFLISSNPTEIHTFAHDQQVDFILVEGGRSLNLPSVLLKRGLFDPDWLPPQNILRTVDLEESNALFETQTWLISKL